MLESISYVEQVPPWLVNWLTPLWLLGFGVLVGLILVAVLWLLFASLSVIPGLGTLKDDPKTFRTSGLVAGIVIFLAGAVYFGTVGRTFITGEEGAGVTAPQALGLILPGVLLSLAAGFALITLVSKRTIEESWLTYTEGPLFPISIVFAVIAIYGIGGVVLVREPDRLLTSLTRIGSVGERTLPAFTIKGIANQEDLDLESRGEPQVIEVSFNEAELDRLRFVADGRLAISGYQETRALDRKEIDVSGDEETTWVAGSSSSPFPEGDVTELYVTNISDDDATLEITLVTALAFPQVMTVPYSALFVALTFFVYFAHRNAMPKLSAVALSTFKTGVAQPVYLLLVSIGVVALVISLWIPYNTFGEDIKVLKDAGLTLIKVLGVLSAIWASSTAITDEIEGRTALTVLSKPIRRQSFIIGKFVGITWTTALMFVILGTVLVVVVSYMPFFGAKEGSKDPPTWQVAHLETFAVVPGLLLAFMATTVLTGICVALSTRLPMLANLVTCFAIYVLGHLTPLLVQSTAIAEGFEPVMFVAQLIAVALPNLEYFDIQAAITSGKAVPFQYLGWSLVYCLIYSLIAMLLSLVLFEDRDVA